MDALFLKLLNMSVSAGWLVLAVVAVRLLFRKAPKWLHCALWALVAVRLLCPFSLESSLSLVPDTQPVGEALLPDSPVVDGDLTQVGNGRPVVDSTPIVPGGAPDSLTPTPENSVDPVQILAAAATGLWLVGVAAMAVYALASTLRLRRQVGESVPLQPGVRLCDKIPTPFILGVFRPCIYLPTYLQGAQMASVLAHEQAHLRRRDHWWKPLGFLLLTVYWFNPLMWVAYILLCRDIEGACDERVVRQMDVEGRKAYSEALLACHVPRRRIAACPLAFGETGVKSRVKSVLHYKKPAFWLMAVALVASIAVGVCFLTDPPTPKVDDALDILIVDTVKQHNDSDRADAGAPFVAYTVFGIKESKDYINIYGMALYQEYHLDGGDSLREGSGVHCAFLLSAEKEGGRYVSVRYWTPKDGSEYEPSIRAQFPRRYVSRALDTQRYIEAHKASCRAQAEAYFGLEDKPIFVPYACDVNGTRFYLDYIKSNTCRFTTSPLSSYMAEGEYTLTATTLTMDFTDFKLVFQKQSEAFVFDANASDPIPDSVKLGADYDLPHGTVFFRDINRELATRETFSRMSWVSDDLERQLYAAVPQDGGEENLPAFCLRSRQEWETFMQTYWGDSLSGDTSWAAEMKEKMAAYDDAFFADYALLVVYYHHGSCSVTPYVADVQYAEEGPTMDILVDVYEPESQDSALGEWFLTVGVPRSAAGPIKEVKASVRKHITEGTANLQYLEQAEITQTPLLGHDGRLFSDESLTYCPETDDEQAPTFRFTSRAQLDAFIAKYRDSLKLNLRQPYAPANFIETVARYDAAFFRDNSLLVVYVMAESGTTYHQVSTVAYSPVDSTMTVYVDRYDQPPINGEPVTYLFTVTVNKVFDGLAKTCLTQLNALQEVDWADDSTTPTVNENFVTHTTQVGAKYTFTGRVVEVSKEGRYLIVESATPDRFTGRVKVLTDQYAGGLHKLGDVLEIGYTEQIPGTDPPQVYALTLHYAPTGSTTSGSYITSSSTSTTTTTTTTTTTSAPKVEYVQKKNFRADSTLVPYTCGTNGAYLYLSKKNSLCYLSAAPSDQRLAVGSYTMNATGLILVLNDGGRKFVFLREGNAFVLDAAASTKNVLPAGTCFVQYIPDAPKLLDDYTTMNVRGGPYIKDALIACGASDDVRAPLRVDDRKALDRWLEHYEELVERYGKFTLVSMSDSLAVYNDAFFRDHTLLLFYQSTGSGSDRVYVERLTYADDGKTLCITVNEKSSSGLGTADIADYLMTVAVKKTALTNVTTIKTEFGISLRTNKWLGRYDRVYAETETATYEKMQYLDAWVYRSVQTILDKGTWVDDTTGGRQLFTFDCAFAMEDSTVTYRLSKEQRIVYRQSGNAVHYQRLTEADFNDLCLTLGV